MAKTSVGSQIKNAYYKTKWKVQDTFAGMNPIKRIGMQKRLQSIGAAPKPIPKQTQPLLSKKVTANAVQAVKTLNQKVQPRMPPAITQPSPAKLAMVRQSKPMNPMPAPLKGPRRPPPPPPSTIPSRPVVPPKLPAKPPSLQGTKLK